MYLALLWLTGVATFGAAVVGYLYSRDTFHPLMFLGPMLAYPYFIAPQQLWAKGIIELYLPLEVMPFVQLVYLAGVLSIFVGVLSAGRPGKHEVARAWPLTPKVRQRLRLAGQILGVLGVVAYLYTIFNVGGFEAAYGKAHGRGWSSLGYVREAKFWVLPALLFMMLSLLGRRLRWKDWAWIAFMAGPLLFHGIVGGWRGQTFAVVATLGLGWYIMRGRRPSVVTFAAAGVGLAMLVLLLVTHREMLALGGEEFEFRGVEAFQDFTGRASRGHEYIYGSATVYDSAERGDFQWGGRYVLKIVVRAIPRAIWPTQYEDVSQLLGISSYSDTFFPTLGWAPTKGASMGLLPDIWKQFWWFGVVVLFAIGRGYGAVWRRATGRGGLSVIVYVLIVAFSLYFTQQTLQALLWRVMLLGGVSWTVWMALVNLAWRRAHSPTPATKESGSGLPRAWVSNLPSGSEVKW